MKFTEIPRRLQPLLLPPDPIVIQHNIKCVLCVVELCICCEVCCKMNQEFGFHLLNLLGGV